MIDLDTFNVPDGLPRASARPADLVLLKLQR